MTVFKTFLKVLNKCKGPIIMYTVFLILFGGINMQTSEQSTSFVSTKPDVLIVNRDEKKGVTKNLIDYIKKHSNMVKVEDTEDARNDALFYRDVNYIIYIPENYRKDFLDGLNPQLEIKTTEDYQASLAEMQLSRYLKVATIYQETFDDEDELISKINETLKKEAKVEVTSKLDTDNLSKIAFYYNFLNYSILAGCVYVICLILSSFKEEMVNKRTIISSTNYKKHNRLLLLSNCGFAFVLWVFYIILSFILLGSSMFTVQGIVYIINSFVFTLCAVTIAFLIGILVRNKEAINGIINVVALGTSFLCGAFVPMDWLPDSVLKIAHFLPSYWYIKTNELLKTMEVVNIENLKPIIINIGVILLFTVLFIALTNIISRKKQKIA